jgi:hypothetical protein
MGFIACLLGVISFAKSGNEIGLIAALLVLPILYAAFRAIFARLSKTESAKLQRVLDELARLPETKAD